MLFLELEMESNVWDPARDSRFGNHLTQKPQTSPTVVKNHVFHVPQP